jgi:hypothetical protein
MLGMHRVEPVRSQEPMALPCTFQHRHGHLHTTVRSETEQVPVTADRRVDARRRRQCHTLARFAAMRASQVLFQRTDDAHTAEPGPGDQHAIRFPRAGRAHLLIQRRYFLNESYPLWI